MSVLERRRAIEGRVVRRSGEHVIVFTERGEFLRVPPPSGGRLRPGQRVWLADPSPQQARRPARRARPWLAAAAVLAMLAGGLLGYPPAARSRPAAVLALEINPSAELDLDGAGRVLRAVPRNGDARALLAGVRLEGMAWDRALARVLERALAMGWLRPGGLVVVAVAPLAGPGPRRAGGPLPPAGAAEPSPLPEQVQAVLRAALAQRVAGVRAAVLSASAEEVRESRREGVSLVRHHLVRLAAGRGAAADPSATPLADLLALAGLQAEHLAPGGPESPGPAQPRSLVPARTYGAPADGAGAGGTERRGPAALPAAPRGAPRPGEGAAPPPGRPGSGGGDDAASGKEESSEEEREDGPAGPGGGDGGAPPEGSLYRAGGGAGAGEDRPGVEPGGRDAPDDARSGQPAAGGEEDEEHEEREDASAPDEDGARPAPDGTAPGRGAPAESR